MNCNGAGTGNGYPALFICHNKLDISTPLKTMKNIKNYKVKKNGCKAHN